MKARYIYNGAKNRFEVVEEEKMEVVKIKEWSNLNGVKNGRYQLKWIIDNMLQINTSMDSEYVADIAVNRAEKEEILGWLKLFGFNIEFIKSPLEQVKEMINKDVENFSLMSCREYGYVRLELAKKYINFIERIEKDD